MALLSEFREFLEEYKVIGLAIAFIIGTACTALVQSLVNNIVMPLIAPLMPSGDWQKATLSLGPIHLGIGAFIASAINFIILALVVFFIAKKILREEKVGKK